jgi:hypothetical protein
MIGMGTPISHNRMERMTSASFATAGATMVERKGGSASVG